MKCKSQQNRSTRLTFGLGVLSYLFGLAFCCEPISAITANTVWFEAHPGFIRVSFKYTLPEIKEFRGGYADFTSKKKAEVFYWSLIRGADFEYGSPEDIRFQKSIATPQPW